jgi:hypothetical protein
MHVLQYIAVKIDDEINEVFSIDEGKEVAYDTVRERFEEMYSESEGLGGWSDWYVVGGGRWNSNPENQYEEAWNDVISYKESSDTFREKITLSIASRIDEFNVYRKHFADKQVSLEDTLNSYNGQMDFSFDLYPLGKMIDMLQGNWDFNSYFYDLTNYSTNTKYVLDDLDTNGDFWYIVPVDFHF